MTTEKQCFRNYEILEYPIGKKVFFRNYEIFEHPVGKKFYLKKKTSSSFSFSYKIGGYELKLFF